MSEPFTARAIAPRVKALLESADLDAIALFLDPDVHWGVPDDPEQSCQNREQVLAWYRRARDGGVRALVTETTVYGERILVSIRLTGRPGSEEADRWQVLTVGSGGIVEIAGYDDRDDALAKALSNGPRP